MNMKATKNTNNLPVPRLEFEWVKVKDSWYKRSCNYHLVIPIDELDIRSNSEDECGVYDEWKVLMGETNVTGGGGEPVFDDGTVQSPFRDSVHMLRDNSALGGNLPMYAVCGDKFSLLEPFEVAK